MARSKQTDSGSAAGVVLVVLAIMSWLVDQPLWARVLLTVSYIVVALGLWALFWMPASCKVANRTRPYGCKTPVRGMLKACYRPDHKARKRRLIWARLRGRPPAAVPRSAPTPRAAPVAAARSEPVGPDIGGYWVPGAAYHLTALIFTILGGIGGAAGVVSTVHAFVNGQPS